MAAGACTGTVNAAYAYDPLGRRNHKSGTGVNERYFLLDGDDDVLEFDGGKNVVAFYVPGPAIDEPIVKSVPNGSGGYTHEYFHTNHQGSVIAMSDDSAALAEGPFLYDPYGNCFKGSTPCASLTGSIPYKFTGRRLDEETGLYYYRARCYSPTLGRFCQTDPVGYTADLNLYTYVGNDPTNRTDPTGLYTCVPSGDGKTENCTANGMPDTLHMMFDLTINNLAVMINQAVNNTSSSSSSGNDAGAANDGSKNNDNNNGNNKNNSPPPGKGMNNPKVREAVQKGQQAHKEYEPGEGFKKEQQLPSGRRMDAYNKTTKTIKELKPNSKTGLARGERQLQQYCEECNKEYGEGHTGELETYDPNER